MDPHRLNPFNKKTFGHILIVILIGFTILIGQRLFIKSDGENAVYFLDVGQGDSQLITLVDRDQKEEIKILIDGGRNRKVLGALDLILGQKNNKYLDLVILTHADLDHFGGLIDVLKTYDIGLFIWNGQESEGQEFKALKAELDLKKIPVLTFLENDLIAYGEARLLIISPDRKLLEAESLNLNEKGLVIMMETPKTKALFSADIGFSVENLLLKKGYDLSADILKVPHHGSKNSTGENFVAAIKPVISGIGVGQNKYGHPAPRVLEVLDLAGSRIYRTDQDGIVGVILDKDFVSSENFKLGDQNFMSALGQILTAKYKRVDFKKVSLPALKKEKRESRLVSFKECSFKTSLKPQKSPIILSEVAWMGSSTGATHEWLELENISGGQINLSGWQLLNGNEKIKFVFPQQTVLANRFLVLARSSAKEALGLDTNLIFTGAIRNSYEGLRLFDHNCNLMDEVVIGPKWPAGDNKTKQTMARAKNLSWVTSVSTGGTPGY